MRSKERFEPAPEAPETAIERAQTGRLMLIKGVVQEMIHEAAQAGIAVRPEEDIAGYMKMAGEHTGHKRFRALVAGAVTSISWRLYFSQKPGSALATGIAARLIAPGALDEAARWIAEKSGSLARLVRSGKELIEDDPALLQDAAQALEEFAT